MSFSNACALSSEKLEWRSTSSFTPPPPPLLNSCAPASHRSTEFSSRLLIDLIPIHTSVPFNHTLRQKHGMSYPPQLVIAVRARHPLHKQGRKRDGPKGINELAVHCWGLDHIHARQHVDRVLISLPQPPSLSWTTPAMTTDSHGCLTLDRGSSSCRHRLRPQVHLP